MCIIIAKNKGVDMPTRETLKQCFTRNKDGAGFAWLENNVLYGKKGMMSWEEYESELTALESRIDLKTTMFTSHFRITTHGGTNPNNCHPFPLSGDIAELKALEMIATGEDKIVMHNGIISGFGSYNGDLSDTQEFIKDFLYYLDLGNKNWNKNPNTIKAVETVLGSRLCVMNTDGTFELLGTGWIEDDGVWYSNSTYKPYTSSYSSKSYGSYYNGKYNYWEEEEDERDYSISYYNKSSVKAREEYVEELEKCCGYSVIKQKSEMRNINYVTEPFRIYKKDDLAKGVLQEYAEDKEYVIPVIDEKGIVSLFCHDTLMFIERTDLIVTDIEGDEFEFVEVLSHSEEIIL